MNTEQTPGAPTEQEWAEAILARLVTVSRLPRWMQAPALGRDMTPLVDLVITTIRPLIDREREAARAEGMAAVAQPVLAVADAEWDACDEHGNPLREGSLGEAADELRAAIPAAASEALARVKAQWQAEAREEERRDWSSWLDGWTGAVGPKPPTVEDVARALRDGPRPFGSAGGES